MKKRILALLLAAIMLLGMTAVAADGSTPAAAANYELTLGRRFTEWDKSGNAYTVYRPASFEHGLLDPVNEGINFDCYLLLYDFANNTEAPRSEYENLWQNNTVTFSASGDPANVTFSGVQTDGHHKYVSIFVTGVYDGSIHAFLSGGQDTGTPLTVKAAQKLNFDANGVANFTSEFTEPHSVNFVYAICPDAATYVVSGNLDTDKRASLAQGYIDYERMLWNNDNPRGEIYTESHELTSVSDDGSNYLLFRIQLNEYITNPITMNGSITMVEKQPTLVARNAGWDRENEVYFEEIRNTPFSELVTGISNNPTVYFYYDDAKGEPARVDFDALTATGPIALERNGTAITIRPNGFGSGSVNYEYDGRTYSFPVEITLPEFGFYKADTASIKNYLPELTVTNENNTFYFIASGDRTISSVTLRRDLAEIAIATQISDTCWEITVNGTPEDQWYNIEYSGTDGDYNFNDWSTGLRINNGKAALIAKMVEKNNGNFIDHPEWSPDTSWNTPKGSSNIAQFFIRNGDSLEPVPFSALSFNGPISGESADENGKYVRVTMDNFGSGNVIATVGDEYYSFPITVSLPSFGFYKSQTANEENFLTDFTVTEENDTFYFMALDGCTIANATLSGDLAEIAEINKISDTCWEITVDGTPDGVWYGVYYSGAEGDRVFSDRGESIRIYNGKPALVFYSVENNNGDFTVHPEWGTRTAWNTSMGYNSLVQFAFNDGSREFALSFDDLTFSGTVSGTAIEHSFVELRANDFGSGSISYTFNGKTYTVPANVGLPAIGFYKAPTRSEANYINEFASTASLNTFYLLADSNSTVTAVRPGRDFAEIATVNKISDTCWEITVTGTPDGSYHNLELDGTEDGYPMNGRYFGLRISDGTPALRIRQLQWDEATDEMYYDARNPLQSFEGNADYDTAFSAVLFYGAPDDLATVTDIEFVGSTENKIFALTDRNGVPYWSIWFNEFGPFTLRFTAGGETYEATYNVGMRDPWFFDAPIFDEEHYLPILNVWKLTDNTCWFMSENGFTAEDVSQLEFRIDGSLTAFEAVQRENASTYDIKIVISDMEIGGMGKNIEVYMDGNHMAGTWLEFRAEGSCAYMGDYAIGFAWTDEDTGIIRINEGDWSHGNGSSEQRDNYVHFRDLQIAAGVRKVDEQGGVYYLVDNNDKKVKVDLIRTWIEEYTAEEVFSFSEDTYLAEKSGYSGPDITLYAKEGHPAFILIYAEADVTINGTTERVTVSMICENFFNNIVTLDRPMDDTVAALNRDLADLAAQGLQNYTTYFVNLAPIEYRGTIVVPDAFQAGPQENDLCFNGAAFFAEDEFTSLVGSFDLNKATVSCISDVHFKAPNADASAIYGGALLNMINCSFEGYDIAVNGDGYMMTITSGNVFVDNRIAVYLDIANNRGGMNANGWANNTFIRNGTAVQVDSLNEFISSYYFRIVDSNFIGNGTDFNIDTAATLYMYRNYYGKVHPQAEDLSTAELLALLADATTDTKLNQIVTSNSPEIDCNKDITKVITNPRWKKPVLGWWYHEVDISLIFPAAVPTLFSAEEEYENILISDWELATQIVNEESGNLIIAPESFEEEGEKVIDVVDTEENPLGRWNFD